MHPISLILDSSSFSIIYRIIIILIDYRIIIILIDYNI